MIVDVALAGVVEVEKRIKHKHTHNMHMLLELAVALALALDGEKASIVRMTRKVYKVRGASVGQERNTALRDIHQRANEEEHQSTLLCCEGGCVPCLDGYPSQTKEEVRGIRYSRTMQKTERNIAGP